jgi:Domain of unknown function (DUF6930)
VKTRAPEDRQRLTLQRTERATASQDKAMATQRQLERLVQQVQCLPQHDEYWAATSRLARMWITPKRASPYRPYITLVLSQHGKIVSSHVLAHPPTADVLLEELLRAMRRPAWGAGRARRPTRMYLDNAEHVAALTPLLNACHIQCVYRYALPMAAEVMVEMETQIGKYKPLPGLVSIPAVTPQMLEHLYHLAAQFYRAAPWRWLNDHHPFAIQCPPEDAPRYAMVMGSGREVFGLAVYDRLEDVRLLFTSPVSPRQLARMSTWCVLFFEEAPAVSFEDLDAITAHDWPVAAPHAYPVFGRTTADQEIALPTKADLLWMEGALGALLAYLDAQREVDQGQGQPAALTVSVPRVDGEAHVHLRLLAFDAIIRQDLGV